jgi:hypothetical protein
MIDRDTSLSLKINGRTTLTPNGVIPGKVEVIRSGMEAGGWPGRPIIMYDCGDYVIALTGSHRLCAAHDLGLDVPVVWVPELDATQWDILQSCCNDEDLLSALESMSDIPGMGKVIKVIREEVYYG